MPSRGGEGQRARASGRGASCLLLDGYFTRRKGVHRPCTLVQRGEKARSRLPRDRDARVGGIGAVPARPDRGGQVAAQGGLARARLAIAERITLVTFSLARSA